MKITTKHISAILAWTAILATIIYLVFVSFEWHCPNFLFFYLFLIAAILYDFNFCNWQHPYDLKSSEQKENEPLKNFISKVEFNYQCYDANWKNCVGFVVLFLHGIIVFFLADLLLKDVQIHSSAFVNCFAVFIPYLFHKAYYFANRIPPYKEFVYVYNENKPETLLHLDHITKIQNKVKPLAIIPRQYEDWLFHTTAVVTDVFNSVTNKSCPVPCINTEWSYRQLFNIIFFRNNQPEAVISIYKTAWNKLNIYSGNDYLVKTCWEMEIETGGGTSGIPMQIQKINDFSKKEFNDEKIKVNGLIRIKRIL